MRLAPSRSRQPKTLATASFKPGNTEPPSRISPVRSIRFTVALVKTDKVESVMKTIEAEYTKRTGIKPTMFVSRPGQGATLLKG